MFKHPLWIWRHLEELIGSFLLVLLLAVGTMQVGGRYMLNSPLGWTDELSRYIFVWLSIIGASMALREREHFALEVLVDMAPRRLGVAARMFGALAVTGVLLLLVYFGWVWTRTRAGILTPALEIPVSVPYSAIPIGAALMVIRSLEYLVELMRTWRTPALGTAHPKGGVE